MTAVFSPQAAPRSSSRRRVFTATAACAPAHRRELPAPRLLAPPLHSGTGIYRANSHSPRLIGVRKGKVRFFAVANRKLLRNRRRVARHLRLAGVGR